MKSNYYEILGVSQNSTQEEIKKVYYQLAQQLHPDKLQDNPLKHLAEEQFKKVNEAYQILSDPEKRAKYDEMIKNQTTVQMKPETPETGKVYCKEHPNVEAEYYCHGCNQPLCVDCAKRFNLQLCPDCLVKYNRQYIDNLKSPFIKTAIVGGIGFLLGIKFGLGLALGLMFYFIGVLWVYDNLAGTISTGFVGSLFFGSSFMFGNLIFVLGFGWIIGLFNAAINLIPLAFKLSSELEKTKKAEEYIKNLREQTTTN